LDLDVRFDDRVIRGTAVLAVERTSADTTRPLVLDTRGLTVEAVEASADGGAVPPAGFDPGKEDPGLGRALTLKLPPAGTGVRGRYATGPRAAALQWLAPGQTAGKKHPFLFTHSEAIDARSWLPVQDTPAVRVTYTARVRTPKDLLAVMGAGNNPTGGRTGDY